MVEAWSNVILFLQGKGYDISVDNVFEALKTWRNLAGIESGVDYEYWAKLMICYVFKILGIKLEQRIIEEAYSIYVNVYKTTLRPYSDVRWFLDNVKKHGLPIAAITNGSSHDATVNALEYNNLLDYFDVVVSSQLIGYRKPSSVIFIKAAEFLGVKPQEMIHLGDDPVKDFDGAINAGYKGAILIARHKPCEREPCFNELSRAFNYIKTIS